MTTPFDLRGMGRGARGLTLVEACVVLAVTAVVAASAAPGLQDLIDARRLQGSATQLATDLQLVRTEAIARNEPLRLSVRASAGGGCYVIHTGNANQCDCTRATNQAARCESGAQEIKTVAFTGAEHVSLQGNVASLLFDPLHGTSTPAGTLRVLGTHGRAVHHVVNVMGRVRSCSPGAAVPGYRAC